MIERYKVVDAGKIEESTKVSNGKECLKMRLVIPKQEPLNSNSLGKLNSGDGLLDKIPPMKIQGPKLGS